MKKYLSRRKMKTILAAIVLGLCFGMSGYAHAADASAFETPEYFAGRGLNAINASAAYAKGYTGQGVTVGISDEPISFASPEFSTKRNSSYAPGFYPTFEDEDGTVYTVKDPDYWSIFAHATFLAGIVAASRNGLGMHGVAFEMRKYAAPYSLKNIPWKMGGTCGVVGRKRFWTIPPSGLSTAPGARQFMQRNGGKKIKP